MLFFGIELLNTLKVTLKYVKLVQSISPMHHYMTTNIDSTIACSHFPIVRTAKAHEMSRSKVHVTIVKDFFTSILVMR